MTTDPGAGEQGEWRSTLAGLAAAYPDAFRVGVGYWSELAGHASTCYLGVLSSLVAAWREPGRSPDALGDAQRALREFLLRSGDATERAILDFNERFTGRFRSSFGAAAAAPDARSEPVNERLRDLADRVSLSALQFQESRTPADLRSVREQLERLLQELRVAESDTPRAASGPPGR